DRIAIAVAYDRAAVAIGVLVEIGLAILADIPRELVGPKIFFAPERLEVGSEALVEPCVRPIAARQQIAPPLMSKLVRDQRIALEVEMRARVVQRAVGLRRRRSVFHPAEDKIADRDLRVLGVGIGHADRALEKLDHLRRVAKRAARVVLP